jgi:hypothetical protein
MSGRREAIQLAIIEMAQLNINTAERQEALSTAQIAGVTVADFLWAHTALRAAHGEVVIAEILIAEDAN